MSPLLLIWSLLMSMALAWLSQVVREPVSYFRVSEPFNISINSASAFTESFVTSVESPACDTIIATRCAVAKRLPLRDRFSHHSPLDSDLSNLHPRSPPCNFNPSGCLPVNNDALVGFVAGWQTIEEALAVSAHDAIEESGARGPH